MHPSSVVVNLSGPKDLSEGKDMAYLALSLSVLDSFGFNDSCEKTKLHIARR
jgi:hypothetical protein